MSSKFAPPSENGDSAIKFAEMEIWASQQAGKSYWDLVFVLTPADATEQVKQRKVKTFDPSYRAITWPSINALVTCGAIPTPDALFTGQGEMPKKFLVSYQTPKYLNQARQNDIDWAKANNRLNDFETNEFGQLMKVFWPIKLLKIFENRDEWEAEAQNHAQTHPVPQPAPAAPPAPEYTAVLSTLPLFVKNSGLDLGKLTGMLANPPLSTYFKIDSPEVKLEVARQLATKFGQDKEAIKAFLAMMNGYLTLDSQELKDVLEDVPF